MNQDIIKYIETIVTHITPYRVAIFVVLITFFLFASFFWQNRNTYVAMLFNNTMKQQIKWEISDTTQKELKTLTRSGLIGAILVTEIDFRKNQRIYKYFYIDNPALAEKFQPIVANLLPAPFFDDNSTNNDQMIQLLNGSFICNRTQETIIVSISPEIAKIFPYVCRISIPPFIGEFTGILTVGLMREPTATEREILKIAMANTSLSLYEREIKPKGIKGTTVEKQ